MYFCFLFFFLSFLFFLGGMISKMSLFSYLFEYNLFSWSSIDFSYESLFDWISGIFMGVVFLISGSVMIYSKDYSSGDKTEMRFIWLMTLFVLSMLLMVMSGSLLSMMLGWDGLGVISYLLVIYYQNNKSFKSGIITIMTNRLGDILIIISISMLSQMGMWTFSTICGKEVGTLLVIAGCTKSAQVPFSAWLPEAMAAPTPVSSLVHSSTLVTAGVFMLIRLVHVLESNLLSKNMLMYMSLMTMFIAGSSAMLEMDGKKIVASSTLSQLGLMMFMLSNSLWKLTYFHMIMHAFFKALMFMSVGNILWTDNGNQDIRFMSNKFCNSWSMNQGVLVSVLCLMGFPFFCGFFSKDLMLEVFLMKESSLIEKIFFLVGFSFSVFYGIRLLIKLMVKSGQEKIYEKFSESKNMNLGIFVLSVFSLSSGTVYSWLEEEMYMEIMIKSTDKLLGLFIGLIGVLFIISMMLIFKVNKKWKKFFFMMKSWNYSILSGVLSNMLLKKKENFEKDDANWIEELGGKGINLLIKMFIYFFNKKVMNFFLSIFLVFMGIMVLI